MSNEKIAEFLSNVQDAKKRESLRLGVHYRRTKSKKTEQEILNWLLAQSPTPTQTQTPSLTQTPTISAKVEEIPRHKIDAMLKEMASLQTTATLTSDAGVRIEMQPRSLPPPAQSDLP